MDSVFPDSKSGSYKTQTYSECFFEQNTTWDYKNNYVHIYKGFYIPVGIASILLYFSYIFSKFENETRHISIPKIR